MSYSSLSVAQNRFKNLSSNILDAPFYAEVQFLVQLGNWWSRDEYACRLAFGPLDFLFEINDHVIEFFWSSNWTPVRTNEGGSGKFEPLLNHVIINSSNNDFGRLSFLRTGPKQVFERWPKAEFHHVTTSNFLTGVKIWPTLAGNS